MAATLILVLVGCVGTIEGDGGPIGEELTPEQIEARAVFAAKAMPHLTGFCASCHAGSRGDIIGFLQGADEAAIRTDLLAFTPVVVNLEAPASSRLLTKGIHEGSAFTGPQLSDVLEWIQKERVAAGSTVIDEVLETTAIMPQLCTAGIPGDPTCPINSIALDSIGVAGGVISFVAQPTASALYLQRLQVTPGAAGAYLEHPLVVSYPSGAEPKPDMLDRYFNVKLNLMAGGAPAPFSGGADVFVGFAPTDEIRFHFKKASAYQPEDTGPGPLDPGASGCKDLTSFKANAQAPLQTNCAGCHANAGNIEATGALSLVGINAADDTMIKMACDQTRLRANLQDLNNSGLFLAPAPANANHPFRFPNVGALEAFRTPILLWLTAERDAP